MDLFAMGSNYFGQIGVERGPETKNRELISLGIRLLLDESLEEEVEEIECGSTFSLILTNKG